MPGENEVGFEVWLFDFSGDLYDKELTAYFVSFCGKRKFASYTIKRTDHKRYGFGEANTFSERERMASESFLH
ncbi:MAG: riboflavin kinase [Clostridium sp.]